MKLRGVKVGEAVCRLFYCVRPAEITREALSIVSLILAGVRHVGRNIHQAGNRRIIPSFSNYGSSVAVSHKDRWSILKGQDVLRGSHIILKGRLRLLHDADFETVSGKNVVN